MMDERERLGRVVRGFAPPDDAFERLVNRRGRKQRNQRLAAGAVGVLVALATGIFLARSLTSDGVPANPPVEPAPVPAAAGTLVYALGADIYVADPDGTNAVAITDAGAIDDECPGDVVYNSPSWSPDGRYIAIWLYSECSNPFGPETDGPLPWSGVVITDPQGNVVANLPGTGDQNMWSPDSTRVAVWDEFSRPGAFTIGIYGIDGTRESQIAIPPGSEPANLGELIWTPDGASLIVDQLEVPLDGSTPRELPFPYPPSTVMTPVAYSPDGSQVAYGTRGALMVARPDGSEPREVFGDAPYTGTWSPTGELIAVTADAPGDPWAPNQLHVVDVATGSATLLFEGGRGTIPGITAEGNVNFLNVIGFSPEGDRVLFSSFTLSKSGDDVVEQSLWSVGVDGSDARLVVADTSSGAWRSP
jgi:Tol biopolymer transport system component